MKFGHWQHCCWCWVHTENCRRRAWNKAGTRIMYDVWCREGRKAWACILPSLPENPGPAFTPSRTFQIKPVEWNLMHWKWVQYLCSLCPLRGPLKGYANSPRAEDKTVSYLEKLWAGLIEMHNLSHGVFTAHRRSSQFIQWSALLNLSSPKKKKFQTPI